MYVVLVYIAFEMISSLGISKPATTITVEFLLTEVLSVWIVAEITGTESHLFTVILDLHLTLFLFLEIVHVYVIVVHFFASFVEIFRFCIWIKMYSQLAVGEFYIALLIFN